MQQSLAVYKEKLQIQVKKWLHLYTEGNPLVLAPQAQAREAIFILKS